MLNRDIHILLAPAAAGKTEYCLNQIRAARAGQPLAPIWVILPDAAQARAFRRRLGHQGGALNVHIVTFNTLYAELLALAGAALPLLDEPVLHRLLQTIVAELAANARAERSRSSRLSYYAPLQDKPGFFHALRHTMRELKRARIEPESLATAVSDQSPRLQELALIYGRYQQWLQHNTCADDEGRGWLAAIALQEQPRLCAEWRLLLIDGFDQFNPTQLAVLGRLAAQAQETVATLTGAVDGRARPAHHRFYRARAALEAALQTTATPLPSVAAGLAPPLAHLEAALFNPITQDAPPAADALTLLETPTRAAEVRAALRWLKQRHVIDGVPLPELAVLARDLEAYRPFLAETAAEFGLPLQIAAGEWLPQNPAVAALLDLLALPARNWPHRLLLETWRSPYFDWSTQGIAHTDADLLAAVAAEGQVVAGRAQWRETLRRLAAARAETDEAHAAEEGLDETAVLTAPRGAQAAALLQKFDAFTSRVTPPERAALPEYVRWLEEIVGDDPATAPAQQPWQLGRSLGVVQRARDTADAATAERDVAALQRLKDVLRSLVFADAAVASTPLTYRDFWQELAGAVEATRFQPAAPAQGALLAMPVLGARGLSFHAVALLGLCEGDFPRRPPHDPLLRSPDRALLAERDVQLEEHDPADEATLFYEAVTRARARLLLTRPYLANDGQLWEPAPYWEEVRRHSQAAPATLRTADLLSAADAASPPEFVAALAAAAEQSPAAAYRRLLPRRPDLHAAWRRVEAGKNVLTARLAAAGQGRYEGDLSHLAPQLAARYGLERPWSASRLESYAVCGFSFFAGYALGLNPRQPVQAGYDVRQLGSMFHAILEETYRQVLATGETAVSLLPAIAQSEFDAAPQTYGFRPTPLWQRQREELTQILRRTVETLDAESEGWRPLSLEPPFGLQDAPPLVIGDAPGRSLRLRGYIDRVDVDNNGRLRIIDYKSSNTPIAAAALAEGQRIQLALYALAARDALGLGRPVAGMYWHIGSAKPSHLRLEKQEGGVEEGMETAVRFALDYANAIRRGDFTPQPPAGGCPHYCPAADFCWRYQPPNF